MNDFQVLAPDSDFVIPVHACLKIAISFPMHAPTKTVLRMPPSLYDPFLEILTHIHGVDSAKQLTVKQPGEGRQKVRDSVAKAFDQRSEILDSACPCQDTNTIWNVWTDTATSAIHEGREALARDHDNISPPPI